MIVIAVVLIVKALSSRKKNGSDNCNNGNYNNNGSYNNGNYNNNNSGGYYNGF